jgi:hypothetical protein
MSRSDWEDRLGRLVTNDETRASREFGRLASGRVGSMGRTFHCAVERMPATTSRSAIRSRLHYDRRDAEHANRVDELESEGGRTNSEMEEILVKACEAQTRKNGLAGLTLKIELPAEMTAHQRKEVAEAIEGFFEGRECPCHWAIHSHNEKGGYQPHLHMTVTNRAVVKTDAGWLAEAAGTRGRPGSRPVIDGPAEMKRFRREVVAGAINDVAARHGVALAAAWHGGTLKETGIDRMAKRRVPMAAYKGRLTPRPDGPAWANAQIEQGNAEAVVAARQQWSQHQIEGRRARAAERAAAKEARRLAKLVELGGVPKEAVLREVAVPRPLEPLTDKQQQTLLEVHQRLGLEAPDLGTHEGRAAAWSVVKTEKAMRERQPPGQVGNTKSASPIAKQRDWAEMPLEKFVAAKGIKVTQAQGRQMQFDVWLPDGQKLTVMAGDEDRAKAMAHRKLVGAARKHSAADATAAQGQDNPSSTPALASLRPPAVTSTESAEPFALDAAAIQRRITSMSEAELQEAVARTRAKYAPEPSAAPAPTPGASGGARKAPPPLPPAAPPAAPGAAASDGGLKPQPVHDEEWTSRRPRGRGR